MPSPGEFYSFAFLPAMSITILSLNFIQERESSRLAALLRDAETECQKKCDALKEQWRDKEDDYERRLRDADEKFRRLVCISSSTPAPSSSP
jgi:transcription elongation GreA/GreB family factor